MPSFIEILKIYSILTQKYARFHGFEKISQFSHLTLVLCPLLTRRRVPFNDWRTKPQASVVNHNIEEYYKFKESFSKVYPVRTLCHYWCVCSMLQSRWTVSHKCQIYLSPVVYYRQKTQPVRSIEPAYKGCMWYDI